MKKVIAFLLVSVLLVTLMVPAFAGPVEMCPDCSGALIKMYITYRQESHRVNLFLGCIYAIEGVETTTIVCTNTVHKHVKRTFIKYSTDPNDGVYCT